MLLTRRTAATGVTRIARLPLHHGGELQDVRVAYSLSGNIDGPVVVVLGGISAGRQIAPGWWQDFIGPERAVDTREVAVLGIDFVGGSGASTGPRHAAFPAISTYDQADALSAVLDALGIERIAAFIGSSYGGMVALAFGARYPQSVAQLVVISAAHEPHPMATALRSLQRRTIRLGIESGRTAEAIGIARGIAMTTYRTAAEFAERFDVVPAHRRDRFHFPVEDYLAHCGETYARNFSPWGFLCLSESIDLHRVDPADVAVPTTLVSVDSDTLVPRWQMRALAESLGGYARLVEIESLYGHDAFLKEVATISAIVKSTLLDGETR